MSIWYCKIGEMSPRDLPMGADAPMREAIAKAYRELTGRDPQFIFSGWGAKLTFSESAVIEDRCLRCAGQGFFRPGKPKPNEATETRCAQCNGFGYVMKETRDLPPEPEWER